MYDWYILCRQFLIMFLFSFIVSDLFALLYVRNLQRGSFRSISESTTICFNFSYIISPLKFGKTHEIHQVSVETDLE